MTEYSKLLKKYVDVLSPEDSLDLALEKKSFFGRDNTKAPEEINLANDRSEAELELLKALRAIK